MNGMKNYEIKMTAATRPLIHHPKQVAVLCRAMRLSSLSSICQFFSVVHEWNVKICNVFFSPALSRPLSFCICHFRFVLISLWCYVSFEIGGIHFIGVYRVRIWVSRVNARNGTARHDTEMKHDGEKGAKRVSMTANSSEIQSISKD